MTDNIPAPNSLLLIIDIFKVDIGIFFALSVVLVMVLALVSTLLHSNEMKYESGLYPKSFYTILSLWDSHVLPWNIKLIFHFKTTAKVFEKHYFGEEFLDLIP